MIVGGELFRITFHEGASHHGWDGQIATRPQRLSDHGPTETTPQRGNAVCYDVLDRAHGATTFALLLNHDQFQWTAHQCRDGARSDAAHHFFSQIQVSRSFAAEDDLFELATHGKLDHGATPHVDSIRADSAVHDGRIDRDGLFLLHHIFGIVKWLQNQDL